MEALAYEDSIIDECLAGEITEEKMKAFYKHTVDAQDFHKYTLDMVRKIFCALRFTDF